MPVTTFAPPGSAITPPEFAEFFFTHLSAQSVGLASGFRVVRTDRKELHIPRLTSDVGAVWVDEGEEIPFADPGADVIVATPRKLGRNVQITNEALDDSSPAAADLVAESLARSLSLALDFAFFQGSGVSPMPRGLANVAGIHTVPAGGPLTNLDTFATAIGLIEASNARPSAIVMHPTVWTSLAMVRSATDSNEPLLTAGPPTEGITRRIFGLPVHVTSQLPIDEGANDDETSVFIYDASQVVAVIRKTVELATDRSVLFTSDQTVVRGILRADLAVPFPAAVARITGIITPL